MYNLNKEQLAQVQTFINKLEDSLVKSQYEKWLAEVSPTGRVTGEQMEYFVARATHLPVEVRDFPQSFSMAVKNLPEAEKRESAEKTKQKSNLTGLVSDTLSGVKDVNAPDNKEETLHKLGTKGKVGSDKKSKETDAKEADPKEDVREGAKLHSDKEVEKTKPVIVTNPKK